MDRLLDYYRHTAARHAAEHSQPEHVLHLSTILHWHLRSRGRYTTPKPSTTKP